MSFDFKKLEQQNLSQQQLVIAQIEQPQDDTGQDSLIDRYVLSTLLPTGYGRDAG